MHTNNTRITWLVLHNAYNVHIIHTSSYYFYITWEHHAYPNCRRVVPFSLIVLTKKEKNAFFRCAFRGAVPFCLFEKEKKKRTAPRISCERIMHILILPYNEKKNILFCDAGMAWTQTWLLNISGVTGHFLFFSFLSPPFLPALWRWRGARLLLMFKTKKIVSHWLKWGVKNKSSELKGYDGFIVSHAPVLCRLFEVWFFL
jgi:hypothetical protein